MSTETLSNLILAGINRFLIEDSPSWSKASIEKLVKDVDSSDARHALNTLVQKNVIEIIGREDCYFVITEDYLKKNLPPEYSEVQINWLRKKLASFSDATQS